MNIGATVQGRPFTLPIDAVTSTLVALGGKGMGKTNLGSVILEELTRMRQRWCLLDPIGVSWGLRHSRDGKGPGVPCLILGGVHGDIPIDPNGGAAVADIVITENVNVVIDFSRHANGEMWGPTEKVRFCTAYIRQLFRRQGELIKGKRRPPIFQGLDEAARFVPQTIPHGNPELAACVSAWEQAVEEGRNIGLGVGLWTLRSARLNKSVTELADALFAFRTVGPNSLDSIMDWLGQHADKAHVKAFAEQVRSLDRGTCLVVSPGWLKREEIVRVRLRQTFDSSATPKAGEKQKRVQGQGAKPDLASIRERMKTAIEEAKANDPKHLHALLKEAKTEIERLRKGTATAKTGKVEKIKYKTVQVPVVKEAQVKKLQSVYQGIVAECQRHEKKMDDLFETFIKASETLDIGIAKMMEKQAELLKGITEPFVATGNFALQGQQGHHVLAMAGGGGKGGPGNQAHRGGSGGPGIPIVQSPHVDEPGFHDDGSSMGKGERQNLNVIAQYTVNGGEGVTREQLTVITGYKRSSRDTFLQKLMMAGRIRQAGSSLFATNAGIAALGSDFKPLPTGDELRQHWLARLSGGELKIFTALVAAYPKGLTREAIDEATGYKRSSRDTFLQKLGARMLLDLGDRNVVKVSKLLFN